MISLILADVADKCFTPEQKQILEYQQGQLTITIADQLKRYFNGMYLVHSVDDTYNYIAQIAHEYDYLIEEIGVLKERIKEIKTPGNYKRTLKSTTGSLTCSSSDANTDSISRGSTISMGIGEAASTSYSRIINTEPDTLLKQVDVAKDRTKLDTLPIAKEKTTFTSSELEFNKDFLTVVKEKEDIKEIEPVSDNLDYHNSSLSRTGDQGINKNEGYSDTRTLGKTKSNSKGLASGKTINNQEIDILAESAYKSLTVKIPQLRTKFWMKFYPLFSRCNVCQ